MKARIYYQDFKLNNCNPLYPEQLIFAPDEAFYIGEIDSEEVYTLDTNTVLDAKEQFANFIYKTLNTEPDLFFPQEVFEAAGHVSMSFGDYIFFEEDNGEKPLYMIWAIIGWKIIDLDFEEKRHRVKKFIETLPLETVEGMYREIERGKDKEISNILSNNFYRERIRCKNHCPKCNANENFVK